MKFSVPIYGACVYVLVSDPKNTMKWLNRIFVVDDDVDEKWLNQCDGSVFRYNKKKTKEGWYTVFVNSDSLAKKSCKATRVYDIVTHEVLHLTVRIMESVGAEFSADDCEPYAYLHGWLCSMVLPPVMAEWEKRRVTCECT